MIIVENILICFNLNGMENDLNIKEILEWYVTAGVDETFGDVPFGLEVPQPKVVQAPSVVRKVPETGGQTRQATTDLAQATVNACKNARDICEEAQTLDQLREAVEKFEGCALKLTANKTVFGGGNPDSKIMLIGEAPGADEDRMGLPFVGRSGQLLDKMLKAVHVDRTKCYITNVLPWRPPGNRTPTSGEIAVCLPFLKKQIELINPDVIMILGGSAANALLDNEEPISRLRGKWLEYKKSDGGNVAVLASFHPAYLLRNSGQKAKAWSDLLRMYQKVMQ